MKTIWKYEFPIEDTFEQELPRGAQFLAVQTHLGTPCFWVLVDDQAPLVNRTFAMKGTGHPFDETELLSYLGTIQHRGGEYVWHLFVRPESCMEVSS